mmetsp:Transcript_13831/g.54652  ORF Transcript_13831/g.54652 Transcript_13831/m.54652 type:complete len:469 (+) Transcript_13831:273-1679(+)
MLALKCYFRDKIRADPYQRCSLFTEPDCMGNIRTRVGPDGEERVIAASVEKLVARASHPVHNDQQFLRTFLLTYQSFCTPLELMQLLISRYKTATDNRVIRIRVLNTLRKWMEVHGSDWLGDVECLELAVQFLMEDLDKEDENTGARLLGIIENWDPEAERTMRSLQFSQRPPRAVFSPVGSGDDLSMLSVPPLELARQITLIESRLLDRLKGSEFLDQRWAKKERLRLAPNITASIQHFNSVCNRFVAEILRRPLPKRRGLAITHVIVTAVELWLLKNFNGVLELTACLQNSSIHRLKQSWEHVPPKALKLYEALMELTSTDENSNNYRAALKAAANPCIPILGAFLTDITFISDGNPDRMACDPHLINFHKMTLMESAIETIQRFQHSPYCLTEVRAIQVAVESAPVLSEDAAYELSVRLEDRAGRTPEERGEELDLPEDVEVRVNEEDVSRVAKAYKKLLAPALH